MKAAIYHVGCNRQLSMGFASHWASICNRDTHDESNFGVSGSEASKGRNLHDSTMYIFDIEASLKARQNLDMPQSQEERVRST